MRKIILVTLLALPLASCVTTDDNGLRALLAERATRADLEFALAEAACKANARTLVQIARCQRN